MHASIPSNTIAHEVREQQPQERQAPIQDAEKPSPFDVSPRKHARLEDGDEPQDHAYDTAPAPAGDAAAPSGSPKVQIKQESVLSTQAPRASSVWMPAAKRKPEPVPDQAPSENARASDQGLSASTAQIGLQNFPTDIPTQPFAMPMPMPQGFFPTDQDPMRMPFAMGGPSMFSPAQPFSVQPPIWSAPGNTPMNMAASSPFSFPGPWMAAQQQQMPPLVPINGMPPASTPSAFTPTMAFTPYSNFFNMHPMQMPMQSMTMPPSPAMYTPMMSPFMQMPPGFHGLAPQVPQGMFPSQLAPPSNNHNPITTSSSFLTTRVIMPHDPIVNDMNGELDQPVRLRSGSEQAFTCGACGKVFQYLSKLRRHFVVHTRARPYQCPICSKCFSQKPSVRIHLARTHDVQAKPGRRQGRSISYDHYDEEEEEEEEESPTLPSSAPPTKAATTQPKQWSTNAILSLDDPEPADVAAHTPKAILPPPSLSSTSNVKTEDLAPLAVATLVNLSVTEAHRHPSNGNNVPAAFSLTTSTRVPSNETAIQIASTSSSRSSSEATSATGDSAHAIKREDAIHARVNTTGPTSALARHAELFMARNGQQHHQQRQSPLQVVAPAVKEPLAPALTPFQSLMQVTALHTAAAAEPQPQTE